MKSINWISMYTGIGAFYIWFTLPLEQKPLGMIIILMGVYATSFTLRRK